MFQLCMTVQSTPSFFWGELEEGAAMPRIKMVRSASFAEREALDAAKSALAPVFNDHPQGAVQGPVSHASLHASAEHFIYIY